MDIKTAFQNLANVANFATQRGGLEMHQVVALHASLGVVAEALGIEPASQEAPVVPAPANE
jgi:hypothetical protein